MGANLMMRDRLIAPDETIHGVEQVTMEDVRAAVQDLLTAPRSIALVGRQAEKTLARMKKQSL